MNLMELIVFGRNLVEIWWEFGGDCNLVRFNPGLSRCHPHAPRICLRICRQIVVVPRNPVGVGSVESTD